MADDNLLHNVYQSSLRTHAHEIIVMGYQELHAEDFAHFQEPEITGELVRAMRGVLERASAPDWVAYYTIHDDPPLNIPGKRGKRCPRVHIEFERVIQGTRPRLQFEAKRLGKHHGVKPYLGKDGLGCFTSGRYPLTHPEAGTLGYIQSGDEDAWAAQIETALHKDPATYGIANSVLWEHYHITSRLAHTYRSKHHCLALGEDIHIFHILLRFCT